MPESDDGGAWAHEIVEQALVYRLLAMRVIDRAFKDIVAPGCGAEDRETAREFLAGSPMLRHWCRVAMLDPRRVIARATTLDSRRSKRPRRGHEIF